MKNAYGVEIGKTANNVIYEELKNFEKKISMEIERKANQRRNKIVQILIIIFDMKIFFIKVWFFQNTFKKRNTKACYFKPSFRFLIF